MAKLCDPKCYELAEHFLPDGISAELKMKLGCEIQECIEDWLRDAVDAKVEGLRASEAVGPVQ